MTGRVQRLSFFLILASALICGCFQKPAPPPALSDAKPKPDLTKEFARIYLILPSTGTDNSASVAMLKLHPALTALLDESEQRNNVVVVDGSGYFRHVLLAPVKDVETLGMKQTLGRVLAYDPMQRTLLIEIGAAPMARETWRDAAYLLRQARPREAKWGLDKDIQKASQEHPAKQVVCVRIRGAVKDTEDLRAKFLSLLDGPAEKRLISEMKVRAQDEKMTAIAPSGLPVVGERAKELAMVIAPVENLEALAKKIDFAQVRFLDTEHNVIILELIAS